MTQMLRIFALPIFAAVPIGVTSHAKAQAVVNDYSEQTDAAAQDGDLARPAAWQLQFTTGTEEKKVKVSVDLLRLVSVLGNNKEDSLVSDQALNLSVSTPWDKQTDALPASLDGLAKGTKFSLDYAFLGSRRLPGVSDLQQFLWDKAVAACLLDKGQKIGATSSDLSAICSDKNGSDILVNNYLSGREQRNYATGSFEGGLHAFGLSASVGLDDLNFADPHLLVAGSIVSTATRKTSWSIGARYAYYLPKTPTAIGLSADFESAWNGADVAILCPPVQLLVSQCTKIAPTAPTKTDSTKLSMNLRHRFMFGQQLSNVAVSPRLTYAFVEGKKNVWGAELPIYFIPNGKGGLTGGAKLGYRSDSDKLSFGIFLGTAFGLFQ